jgi:hypothetical protein
MSTRCVARRVITASLLLLLVAGLVEASAHKPGNRSNALVARRSADARKPSRKSMSQSKAGCAPCAESVSQKRTSRARGKNVRARGRPCHPKDYVDPKIARNYKSALRDLRRAGIQPKVTSVWRSSESQARLRRCSLSRRCRRANPGLYRALPPGKSMHEAGFAVDIAGVASGPRGAKKLTPQGRRIVGIMRKNGFKWRYGLSDPAHFEADPRKYGYLTPQQAIHKTQTTCQANLAQSRARKKSGSRVSAGASKTKLRAVPVAAKARKPTAKAGA